MWYALAAYNNGLHGVRAALVFSNQLYDIEQSYIAVYGETDLPIWLQSVDAIVAAYAQHALELDALAELVKAKVDAGKLNPVADGLAKLLAPLKPSRIFGTASNYHEHAEEMQTVLAAKADSSPYIFMKASTSVIGPEQTVIIPPETEKPDWEVELAVVIGKAGRRISVDSAIDHIAGYTIVNDISARDMNRRSDYPFKHDWFRGKSWDTFCPMGPWFVPKSCIKDLHNLKLGLSLNGEVKQDGNTSELIWNAFEQIAYLSSILTLQPGDVIATGTPAGVGMGQGQFLQPGDVMVATVEGIGSLRNTVEAENL